MAQCSSATSTDLSKIVGITMIVIAALLTTCASAPTDKTLETHSRYERSVEQRQLNIFIHKMKLYLRDLYNIYTNVQRHKAKLRWLNINKLKTMIDSPNVYQEFYKALQYFGNKLDALKNIHTKADYNLDRRQQIYFKTEKNLLLVRTEFEDLMNEQNIQIQTDVGDALKSDEITSTMDLSELKMSDIYFFTGMRDFFKYSRNTLLKWRKYNKIAAKKLT